jgi:carboxyl-terminal processing protease
MDIDNESYFTEAERHSRKLRPAFSLKGYKGKLAVLVDTYSASAADIFPAAIQEHRRGIIIGTRSSGALIGSKVAYLPRGYRLTHPFVEVLTSQGNRLESNGVVPDIELN